ncbi:ribose xylose arabinose galactoside ABC-type transporter permease [Lactobacillus selangorensis]|uniref:Ribose xylose arabinose galactoside ABC-type transporter permease n=1 Tax=Lactobacillus selangorensis TaxID=81857 RepID=A0A0R2FQE8_9LACO|nr:branched-chain amino acid ABC transporter permease [Lactobacillus selangorensis]KRN27211.1 ribose xylose arabinose galactoside ABC-type transporter permease [Lactobacillus selangorensis]KRN29867.1 ribose xylose arabinose galactoside ABC-type transporter permease [Lactobacillus selangorensis]
MNLIVSAIGQGLLWALLGLGLFLTFRILDFPDMTVEGTFPFGASVCVAALTHGAAPWLATLLAFGAGMLAGLVTGVLATKGHVPVLLAGILVMTGLYSVNLRILGRANVSLLNVKTIFTSRFLESLPPYFNSVVVGMVFIAVVIILLALFLQTELGQAFIATGDHPTMARALGISTPRMEIMGLMLSNGLIGLAGGIIAQSNGYADINMGVGTIVIGLAAIIIGEVAFGDLSMNQRLVAIACGSIFYRFILLIVLQLGFNTDDFKLISAVVLALVMMLPMFENKYHIRRMLKKGVTVDD